LDAAKACAGAGSAALIAGQVILVAKLIGMADVAEAVSKADGIRWVSRRTGRRGVQGMAQDRPINQPFEHFVDVSTTYIGYPKLEYPLYCFMYFSEWQTFYTVNVERRRKRPTCWEGKK
jgi:hypothetical protein